jgi:hypothetical protein
MSKASGPRSSCRVECVRPAEWGCFRRENPSLGEEVSRKPVRAFVQPTEKFEMTVRWLKTAIVGTLLVLGGAWAAEGPTPLATQRAIADLDHAEWVARERATRILEQLDEVAAADALAALAHQAVHGSPEAAVRAVRVLAAFYGRGDFAAMDELESALETLILVKGSVGEAARRAWEQHRSERERRAVKRIEQLGGGVHYAQDRGFEFDESLPGVPLIDFIVIGSRWTGGDDGLKHVLRLSQVRRVYRVKNAPISDGAVERLESAGYAVEVRGAFLGIRGSVPFAGADFEGCLIDSVTAGSPAEKGGLQSQDIVLKFDDKEVKDFNELIDLLKSSEPGQTVTFTVLRGGERKTVKVELGTW